jgi:hypothetical protein
MSDCDSATGSAASMCRMARADLRTERSAPKPTTTQLWWRRAGDFGLAATDLFVYDRSTGSAELRRFDRNGDVTILGSSQGTTWTHLASGRLSGRGLSDVVAYGGDAGAIEISSFDTGELFPLLTDGWSWQ